jgi:hypothetical protein
MTVSFKTQLNSKKPHPVEMLQVTFLITVTKYLTKQLTKGKNCFAYISRGFDPWLFGPMHLGRTPWQWEHVEEKAVHFLAGQDDAERGQGKI